MGSAQTKSGNACLAQALGPRSGEKWALKKGKWEVAGKEKL